MSSTRTPRIKSSSLCLTMRSRILDRTARKSQKQKIYTQVTQKYGKAPSILRHLLYLFDTLSDSEVSFSLVDAKIQAQLHRTPKAPSFTVDLPEITHTHRKITTAAFDQTSETQWAKVVNHDTEQFLFEEQQKNIRNIENKAKLKRELDKQVREKQQKIENEKKETVEFEESQNRFWKTQEISEKRKEGEVKKQVDLEREIAKAYIGEVRKRKQEEALKEKEYEKDVVRKMKEGMRMENEGKKERKRKLAEMYQEMIRENEANKVKINAKIIKEKDEEMKMVKEYTKMLEKQEQDRVEFNNMRETRLQQNQSPLAIRALQTRYEKNIKEEMQHIDNINHNERRQVTLDEYERKKKERQIRRLKAAYESQIKEKEKKLKDELERDKIYAENKARESLNYYKFEEEKQKAEKTNRLKHAEYLKSQISNRFQQTSPILK
jgi:hypothetical protein